MDYDEYMQSEKWREVREQRLEFAQGRCELCNRGESTLEVHHRTYERLGEENLSDLIALCSTCHKTFHEKVGFYDEATGERSPKESKPYRSISTGFESIDSRVGGLWSGNLIVLGGRPSMGTTSLALNIACNATTRDGEREALIVSLQSPTDEITHRVLAQEARVSLRDLRQESLEDEEYVRLARAAGRLSDAKVYVQSHPRLSIWELREEARARHRKRAFDLLVVDPLQKLSVPQLPLGERGTRAEIVARELKSIALELNIPVLATSALSRRVESRGDRRPQLSDLRSSGAIEEEADMVVLLHRAERYGITVDENGNSTESLAEVIIAKQRYGPVESFKLAFVKEYGMFADLQHYAND